MDPVSQEEVLQALRAIRFESLSKDIVQLGLVKDVRDADGHVHLTLELPSPAHPRRGALADRVRDVVRAVPGVESADVRTAWRVRAAETRRPRLPGVKNVVCVASGKGGVGKSTVAANLAVGLAREGAAVGLLDLDIYGPSGAVVMGVDAEAPIRGDGVFVPVSAHGVRFLSMGQIARGDRPIIWRGPMLHKMVTQLIGAEWGELDYLFLDLPPGTGDVQLTVTQGVPVTGAVIVTTPQEIALIDARKGLTMFRDNRVAILGIVENMASYACRKCGRSHAIFGADGGADLAAAERVALLGRLPLDASFAASGDAGKPAVLEDGLLGDALRRFAAETAAAIGTLSLQSNPFHVLT